SLSGSEDVQIDWHTRSLAELTGSKLPERNPQIEAVCADGGGRIFLLQETPPRLNNTAAATSSICTAPLQNQPPQALYLAYTARSQCGINPRGRSVRTFKRRCFR